MVGCDFDLELLAAVTDLNEFSLLDGLDNACRTRLIEETSADCFRFSHALVRHSLYQDLSATWRRRLHRQVTEALIKLDRNEAASLARHAVQSGFSRDGAGLAVSYVVAAAEQASAARALSEAEGWYRQALDLLNKAKSCEPQLLLQVLCGLGEVQRDQGDPACRQTLLDAGRAAIAQGRADLAARASVSNFRGLTSTLTGVDHEGRVARGNLEGCRRRTIAHAGSASGHLGGRDHLRSHGSRKDAPRRCRRGG